MLEAGSCLCSWRSQRVCFSDGGLKGCRGDGSHVSKLGASFSDTAYLAADVV